jgi:hypothetical protein
MKKWTYSISKDLRYWFLNHVVWKPELDKLVNQTELEHCRILSMVHLDSKLLSAVECLMCSDDVFFLESARELRENILRRR